MNVFITIGGNGLRMKDISPKDKHLLYYKDKRVIECILSVFPKGKIIGNKKTNNRKETLKEIEWEENCLIIDCDIIPYGIDSLKFEGDTIIYFNSEKNKYGSLIVKNNIVESVSENKNLSSNKCSGVYYIESIKSLLNRMTDDNSIASGMIGAKTIKENTFIRLGDVEDYFAAL
ncbi:MAG: hypothetical protein O2887_10245 [Bacteroidetes bacterium]|nr:hypothetical protein [Bacteroidota bacterium]